MRFRKSMMRMMSGLIVLAVITGISSGCNGGAEQDEWVDDGGPLKISLFLQYYESEAPTKTPGSVWERLEEMTNTELDITWVPHIAYKERVNLALTTQSLPQVVYILGNRDQNVIQAVDNDVFWDLSEYIDDYPNLSKKPEAGFEATTINGKQCFLYKESLPFRRGWIYRADWLENLGLEVPKTLDEFYELLRAFTFDDPNQSGQPDTTAWSEHSNLYVSDALAVAFGAPNMWGIDEEKERFVYYAETPEYFEHLKFYKKAFEEGLMNDDFPIVNKSIKENNFKSGKYGLYGGSIVPDIATTFEELYELEPDAKLDYFMMGDIEGPKGHRQYAQLSHDGGLLFTKKEIKTEAHLRRILEFFDRVEDEDVQLLIEYGIEGRHYTMDGDEKVRTEEQFQLRFDEVRAFDALYTSRGIRTAPYDKEAERKFYEETLSDEFLLDTLVHDISQPYISQFQVETGNMQTHLLENARTMFIYGNYDEDDWNEVVTKWQNDIGIEWGESLYAEYLKYKD